MTSEVIAPTGTDSNEAKETYEPTGRLALPRFALSVASLLLLVAITMEMVVLITPTSPNAISQAATESLVAAGIYGIWAAIVIGFVGLGYSAQERGVKLFLYLLAALLLAAGVLMTLALYAGPVFLAVGANATLLGVIGVCYRIRTSRPKHSFGNRATLGMFVGGALALGALFFMNSGPTPVSATVEPCGDMYFFRVDVTRDRVANWGWNMYGTALTLDQEVLQHVSENGGRIAGHADDDGFWSEHLSDEVDWRWVDGSANCFDGMIWSDI